MPSLFFSALLILAPIQKAPTLNDGFYEVLDKGEGTRFLCNDGQTLILGKSLGKQFGKASIRSHNNDNTRFGLTLKGAAKLWDGPESLPLALVVENVCLRLSGNSIPNADETRDLWFAIEGLEPARRVAKALKCDIEFRKDPGHRLRVTWTPDKEAYQPGDTITLKFELRNTGKANVTFRIGGSQRGARDNQYRFVAQAGHGGGKGVQDTGDPNNFGGKSWTKTLKPDESYTAEVQLNNWFQFNDADTYRVTGIWSLHLEDGDRGWAIWDDLVCGECYVRVERRKK
jgi:hypothetical protein